MKKFLLMLLCIASVSFAFVSCEEETTTPSQRDYDMTVSWEPMYKTYPVDTTKTMPYMAYQTTLAMDTVCMELGYDVNNHSFTFPRTLTDEQATNRYLILCKFFEVIFCQQFGLATASTSDPMYFGIKVNLNKTTGETKFNNLIFKPTTNQ